jgi:hypothetical protein
MKPSSLLLSFAGLSCASISVFDVSVSSSSIDAGDYWICAYTKANTNFSGGIDASVWRQCSFRSTVFGGAVLQWGINAGPAAGGSQSLSWQVLSYTTGSLPSSTSSLSLQACDAFTPFICVR